MYRDFRQYSIQFFSSKLSKSASGISLNKIIKTRIHLLYYSFTEIGPKACLQPCRSLSGPWPSSNRSSTKQNAAAQALSRGGPCRIAGPALTTALPAHQAPTWAWAGKVPPHLG
jgi:hypothetical protein